jgi:hypothetical protein
MIAGRDDRIQDKARGRAVTGSATRRFFFILGSPRSGTTLLQSMLTQSPQVTVPPETQFLAITHRRRREFGPIESDRGWERATEAVVQRNERIDFPIESGLLRERLLATSSGERSYKTMLSIWLNLCAEEAGATVVGEKSPVHSAYVDRLLEMFPDTRFLQIVRDPRDVAMSQREVFGRSLFEGAFRWRLDQRALLRHVDRLGQGRFTYVRYEDLIAEVEPTVVRLCEFLDIEFVPSMLDPSKRKSRGFASDADHKLLTLQPVTRSRIARYKGKLTVGEIGEVQAVCGGLMTRFGYERDPASRLHGSALLSRDAMATAVRRGLARFSGRPRDAGGGASTRSG